MESETSRTFFLVTCDPETASIVEEFRFDVDNVTALASILEISETDLRSPNHWPLDPVDVTNIAEGFGLKFNAGPMPVSLRPWQQNDALPYVVHTGRELAMMLAGTKPLAAFIDEHPSLHGIEVIPEGSFAPHVESGRILKREHIEPLTRSSPIRHGHPIGSRRVLYALPEEEWRFDAYLELWAIQRKSGWSEELERREGILLGYEPWQNDIHIARGWKPPRPKPEAE